MVLLKCFLTGCGVVAVLWFVFQLTLCLEYDEWRKVYIPVSNALGKSIDRVKLLQSLIEGTNNPTLDIIREYKEEFVKMKSLAVETDRLWKLNPRRVNGEKPVSFIDTVKRRFRKKK